MKCNWLHNCAGICLAEALIATAAGIVVLSASIQALKHFDRRLGAQQEAIARHQDLRIGLKVLEDELRLAATGAGASGTPLLKTETGELVFLANLAGFSTSMTQPISPGQQQLSVGDGAGWPKNKRVVVCSEERCAESRLARDGQEKTLSLTTALGQAFPIGSTVVVSNQVRYYLGKDSRGKSVLMRQVDGGTNPLIGDVAWFRLHYLDRDGRPTQDANRVTRLQVELAVGNGRPLIKSEIGLRAI
jgi:hypothetical protein